MRRTVRHNDLCNAAQITKFYSPRSGRKQRTRGRKRPPRLTAKQIRSLPSGRQRRESDVLRNVTDVLQHCQLAASHIRSSNLPKAARPATRREKLTTIAGKVSASFQELNPLPRLYFKGLSTGDFATTLTALLGQDAPGLLAATISR